MGCEMEFKDMQPATLAAQAGGAIDMQSGGVVPPIQPSTTFARDRDYDPLNAANTYARDHNDVVRQAESVLAQLEGGSDALLFPSGMAAVAALSLMSLLQKSLLFSLQKHPQVVLME